MPLDNASEAYCENGESKTKRPQYVATVLATLSAVSVGTCLAWTSPSNPIMTDRLHITTKSENAWVGSLMTLGGFVGALPAGFIVNSLGRKTTLIFIHIPMIIAWVIISICVSSQPASWIVWGLYFGRFLSGLAVGIISVAASMYISELAENSVRGTLGTFYQLQVTVGILYANLVGLFDNVLIITILCCIIPFIFIGTFIWMPESPVFLLSKNKKDEATKSLQWFRGSDYQVEPELNRMHDALQKSQEEQAGITDIVSDFVTLKALIIVLGLMVFQQLSGVNAVIFYTGDIFKSAGSSLPPTYSAIIISVVQVIATYSSSLLIEKAGRRGLLLLSGIVMATCLLFLGGYFYFQEQGKDVSSWSWIPLLSLAVFIIVFSLGYGPIPWIIMGELVPNNLKGISSALAACGSWLLAFTVTNNFDSLTTRFGAGPTFWGFSVICIIGAIFVGILLPETKGKDIQVILEELGKKPSNITLESTKTHC